MDQVICPGCDQPITYLDRAGVTDNVHETSDGTEWHQTCWEATR